MAGGGATMGSNIPTTVESPYRALMFGNQIDTGAAPGTINGTAWGSLDSYMSWSAATPTTYAQNPSMMRWLHEYGQSAAGGNPYFGVTVPDPELDLTDIMDDIDAFRTWLLAVDPATGVTTFAANANSRAAMDLDTLDVDAAIAVVVDLAKTYAGEGVADALQRAVDVDLEVITSNALAAYKVRQQDVHDQVVTRFTAGMADQLAHEGSAFVLGVALLESDHEKNLNDFQVQLSTRLAELTFASFLSSWLDFAKAHISAKVTNALDEQRLRVGYITRLTELQGQQLADKGQLYEAASRMRMDGRRMKVIADNEYFDKSMEVDALEITWDAELFQKAANVLSAVNGSVVPMPAKMSRGQSALSGALAGASIGAKLGPHAAAVGGLVGGVAGMLTS